MPNPNVMNGRDSTARSYNTEHIGEQSTPKSRFKKMGETVFGALLKNSKKHKRGGVQDLQEPKEQLKLDGQQEELKESQGLDTKREAEKKPPEDKDVLFTMLVRKKELFQAQRVQEAIERDLNDRLTKIEDLEKEVLLENPGVDKYIADFKGKEVPIYVLKGLPYAMLSTTIDFRKNGIFFNDNTGQKTYREIMANPAVWTKHSDEVEGLNKDASWASGENTKNGAISTSYHNSEKNADTYVMGELIYGFDHVDADSIIRITNKDGRNSSQVDKNSRTQLTPVEMGIIDKLESFKPNSNYNELLIRRYSETGEARRPDYIIAHGGRITKMELRHAVYFNIPIVDIRTKYYPNNHNDMGMDWDDTIKKGSFKPSWLRERYLTPDQLKLVTEHISDIKNQEDLNSFLECDGIDANKLAEKTTGDLITENLEALLSHGADANLVARKMLPKDVAKNFKLLLEYGVNPDSVFQMVSRLAVGRDKILENLEILLEKGADVNRIARDMSIYCDDTPEARKAVDILRRYGADERWLKRFYFSELCM